MSSAYDPGLVHDIVIVIFGAAVQPDGGPSRTLRDRVVAAAAFGRDRARPLYLATGAVGRYGASEASVMAALLRHLGVPETCILLEETGTDTLSSVRAIRRMLRERQTEADVFVATSGYHLPRCVMLLRMAGIAAHACPPPPASDNPWRRWFWRLREMAALPYDAALMLALRLLQRH